MKKAKSKFFAVLLTFVLIICEFSGNQFAKAAQTGKVYEGEGYSIFVKEQSAWENGSVSEVTIQNTGDGQLRNWQVEAQFTKGTVENAWNVQMAENDEVICFSCQENNRVIRTGESITFGYQLKGGNIDTLEEMKLVCQTEKENPEEDYSIQYRVVNEWDRHAVIEAEIVNNTDVDIEDWQVRFDYAANITNIWNAKLIQKTDKKHTIKNMDYNAVIPANGKVSFGFEAEFQNETVVCPENSTLQSAGTQKRRKQCSS